MTYVRMNTAPFNQQRMVGWALSKQKLPRRQRLEILVGILGPVANLLGGQVSEESKSLEAGG